MSKNIKELEEIAEIRAEAELYAELARGEALRAHAADFSRRRGPQVLGEALVAWQDNGPYGDFEPGQGSPRRDSRLAEFVARAPEVVDGLELVASASYPRDGESAGYTQVRLFRVPYGTDLEQVEEDLLELWREIFLASLGD